MLNLVCRNSSLKDSVLERLRAVFPTILSKKVEGEVNEVLLCSRRENETSDVACIPQTLNQAAKSLQTALRFRGAETKTNSSPHIDVAEWLKGLKVV